MRRRYLQQIIITTVLLASFATAGVVAQAPDRLRIPQGPPGTVTLPVGDYDRLLQRASQPAPATDRPPVPAVVARTDVHARVDGTAVQGTIRIEGEVFQPGPVKVPLVVGTTLLDARTERTAVPLVHEGHANGDVHAAIVTGPAPFSLTLDWAASLASAPGRAAFVLPQPVSTSANATIDLAGDPADFRVEPGLVTSRTSAKGRTTIEITLVPGARTQASWSVREATQAITPAEVRTLADVRSLVTIGDADLRMVSLIDITVVRGQPRTFAVQLPGGYDVSAVTSGSIETSDTRGGIVTLTIRDPSRRRHQFLISLEQPHSPGSFKMDTSFPTVVGTQRESGEIAIEGIGAVEVAAAGDEHVRRMDVREAHASLRALARHPLLAAFRYQRRANETRALALDVERFADAAVIAAAAEHATATTLVTSEGRMLTEVSLRLRNRAQPFMKIVLPAGAVLLSVEVAGETARPVVGTDGTRIPLLRTGFRPDGPYTVSFVYLHAVQAFARRGDTQAILPKLDVPVSILEWELFLPEQYSTKPIAGNVIPATIVERSAATAGSGYGPGRGAGVGSGTGRGTGGGMYRPGSGAALPPWGRSIGPGQIVGRVTDPTGAPIPGATITVTDGEMRLTATSDADGYYAVHGVPSANVLNVTSELAGFSTLRHTLPFDQRPRRVDLQMQVGAISETVSVAAAPLVDDRILAMEQAERRSKDQAAQQAPSQNVINLQRRVAGVLPVRVDVPRSGIQHRFVRPLVLDDETHVSFRYKAR